MRPTGRAIVSRSNPQAHAICDRCGFRYNHYQLRWQFQWQGPRIQNQRFLVCSGCWDKPQEQLRTIVIPPDPVPIMNARPENYSNADNPGSGIGASPNVFRPQYGQLIGTLTFAGGLPAAFDANHDKASFLSACNTISLSSFNNWVGMSWTLNNAILNMPSSLMAPVVRHSLLSFAAYAPSDRGFLGSVATSYVVQASQVANAPFGAWVTISSGVTTGTPGETISGDCTGPQYAFHRIAFEGDQANYVSVAGVEFNIAQTGETVTAGSS